jgi:hypothetical protein
MKIKIKDVKAFKSLVNTVIKSIDPAATNLNERCVCLRAEDSYLILVAMVASKYKLIKKFFSVEVVEEGEAIIKGSDLNQMVKSLSANSNTCRLESDISTLSLIGDFGGVKEPLYHEKNPFRGMFINSAKEFENIYRDCGEVAEFIRKVASFSSTGEVYLSVGDKSTDLYTEFFNNGFVKVSVPIEGIEFSGFVQTSVAQILPLGESLSLDWCISPKSLRFYSQNSSFTFLVTQRTSNYAENIEWALTLPTDGAVVIDVSSVLNAINFQSYACKTGSIRVGSEDSTNISLLGSSGKTSKSILETEAKVNFDGHIDVSVEGFNRAVNLMKKLGNTKFKMSICTYQMSPEDEISMLIIKGADAGQVVLYERVELKR